MWASARSPTASASALPWAVLSTILIWAAPAQVILISALGAGAPPLEAGLAVGLERGAAAADGGGAAAGAAVAHDAALRPGSAGAFHRGQHVGRDAAARAGAAARAPHRLLQRARHRPCRRRGRGERSSAFTSPTCCPTAHRAAMLFLTPMSFLISALRNARLLSDQAGARHRRRHGAAARLRAGRPRSAVDRASRRQRCLWPSPPAGVRCDEPCSTSCGPISR